MARTTRQAAVLAFRGETVCMITSRNKKRWVIPKGRIEALQTPAEAALAEAWEEAGLLGAVTPDPIGTFIYSKNGIEHHVLVYGMRVKEERRRWPECYERRREWVAIDVALERIDEPSLRDLVAEYAALNEELAVAI